VVLSISQITASFIDCCRRLNISFLFESYIILHFLHIRHVDCFLSTVASSSLFSQANCIVGCINVSKHISVRKTHLRTKKCNILVGITTYVKWST